MTARAVTIRDVLRELEDAEAEWVRLAMGSTSRLRAADLTLLATLDAACEARRVS